MCSVSSGSHQWGVQAIQGIDGRLHCRNSGDAPGQQRDWGGRSAGAQFQACPWPSLTSERHPPKPERTACSGLARLGCSRPLSRQWKITAWQAADPWKPMATQCTLSTMATAACMALSTMAASAASPSWTMAASSTTAARGAARLRRISASASGRLRLCLNPNVISTVQQLAREQPDDAEDFERVCLAYESVSGGKDFMTEAYRSLWEKIWCLIAFLH